MSDRDKDRDDIYPQPATNAVVGSCVRLRLSCEPHEENPCLVVAIVQKVAGGGDNLIAVGYAPNGAPVTHNLPRACFELVRL